MPKKIPNYTVESRFVRTFDARGEFGKQSYFQVVEVVRDNASGILRLEHGVPVYITEEATEAERLAFRVYNEAKAVLMDGRRFDGE